MSQNAIKQVCSTQALAIQTNREWLSPGPKIQLGRGGGIARGQFKVMQIMQIKQSMQTTQIVQFIELRQIIRSHKSHTSNCNNNCQESQEK